MCIRAYLDNNLNTRLINLNNKQQWTLEAYKNASDVMIRASNAIELIEGVCAGITNKAPFVLAWVGLKQNDADKSIKVAGVSGPILEYIKNIQVSWNENKPDGLGPTGRCIRSDSSVCILDTEADPTFLPWRQIAIENGIKSLIAVPVHVGNEVIGALLVYANIKYTFDKEVVTLFENLANQIGFSLNALEKDKLLELSLEMTITALSTAMETRDPYTVGHSNRVARISVEIAKRLGWDEPELKGLKKAALAHDIGKIGVPIELLTKPSPLCEIERGMINLHVIKGYEILKDIPFPQPVAEMVRQHHERIDGSGYPFGLKSDGILPGAKIIGAADTIEAMSTNRPYRFAKGLNAAILFLSEESGRLFDPDIVDVCKQLNDEGILRAIVDDLR